MVFKNEMYVKSPHPSFHFNEYSGVCTEMIMTYFLSKIRSYMIQIVRYEIYDAVEVCKILIAIYRFISTFFDVLLLFFSCKYLIPSSIVSFPRYNIKTEIIKRLWAFFLSRTMLLIERRDFVLITLGILITHFPVSDFEFKRWLK